MHRPVRWYRTAVADPLPSRDLPERNSVTARPCPQRACKVMPAWAAAPGAYRSGLKWPESPRCLCPWLRRRRAAAGRHRCHLQAARQMEHAPGITMAAASERRFRQALPGHNSGARSATSRSGYASGTWSTYRQSAKRGFAWACDPIRAGRSGVETALRRRAVHGLFAPPIAGIAALDEGVSSIAR